MEKLTKQDIKGPDAFLQQATKVAGFTKNHVRAVVGAVSIIVVLGVIWAGWGVYIDKQEGEAQDLLYNVDKKVKAHPNDTSVTDDLTAIVNKYGLTQASVFAALEASKIYYDQNKNQEAIKLLEKVSNTANSSTIKALVLNNLATNYEALGNYQKAIDTLNLIETRDDMNFMLGSVYLKKGLCFEKLGQKEQAEQMYKKAEGLAKNPEIVATAKKYLRVLR